MLKAAWLFFLMAVLTLIFVLPASSQQIVLKTAGQDFYPKFFITEEGKVMGICAEVAYAVEKKTNIKFIGLQSQLPLKRLLKDVEKGMLDIMFGFKKNEQRAKRFRFIGPPLYSVNFVLVKRADDPVEINSIDDIRNLGKKGLILGAHGSGAYRFLEKKGGLLLDDGGKDVVQNLNKLKKRRGRFYFHHDLGINANIKKENLGHEVTVFPHSFNSTYHYAIVSKKVPAEIVKKIINALTELDKEGELKRIYNKYVTKN